MTIDKGLFMFHKVQRFQNLSSVAVRKKHPQLHLKDKAIQIYQKESSNSLYLLDVSNVFTSRIIKKQLNVRSCLFLVAARCTTTASLLELTSLRAHVWFSMRVWNTGSSAKVFVGLTGGTLALDHDCVLSSWGQQSQLIECHHFASSLSDSLAGTFGDAESANSQFWDLEETDIISDAANNDDDLVLLSLASLNQAPNALKRNDWSVDARHKQTLENDFVELLVCTTVQEAVQLKIEEKNAS